MVRGLGLAQEELEAEKNRKLEEAQEVAERKQEEQKRLLLRKTTSVSEVLPAFDAASLIQRLITGFKETLPFPFKELPWSMQERKEIIRLSESAEFLSKWRSWDGREGA